jgi:DNA-binding GntR family transcriptional regulator
LASIAKGNPESQPNELDDAREDSPGVPRAGGEAGGVTGPDLAVVPQPHAATNGDRNKFEQARDELRDMLISGTFAPNTRLTEAMLADTLQISRGTLRSAFASLANDGYLTLERNRGARTRYFSPEEARDILEAREIFEGAIAAKAAKNATPEELANLRDIVEAMKRAESARDAAGYSRLNRQFHAAITVAAHQATLARAVRSSLHPLVMRQFRDHSLAHPRIDSFEEHQAILSTIVTRNAEAAGAAMRHHIASARRALTLPFD